MAETKPAKTEEKTAEKKATPPPAVRNMAPAPFYFDDSPGAADLPNKGILATKEWQELTPAQWKRRTPEAWGLELANDKIQLRNVPDVDVAAVEAAESKERKRLGRAAAVDPFTESERKALRGDGYIGPAESAGPSA